MGFFEKKEEKKRKRDRTIHAQSVFRWQKKRRQNNKKCVSLKQKKTACFVERNKTEQCKVCFVKNKEVERIIQSVLPWNTEEERILQSVFPWNK